MGILELVVLPRRVSVVLQVAYLSEQKNLFSALSGLFLGATAHGVRGFGSGLASLDRGFLGHAVGLLLGDAAVVGCGLGQGHAVGTIFLHSVWIC